MKKICSLLIFVLISNCIYADISQTEKTRLLQVAKMICGEGDYNYFYSQETFSHEYSGNRRKPSRLVFIDFEPKCGWEHDCKYLYISTAHDCYEVVDSLLPPADISLLPLEINNSGNSLIQQFQLPVIHNNGGNAAGRVYAVIINGGLNKAANHEHYWNDCAFIYQTLHNVYEIPRSNIKVVYADGTDPEPDLITNNTEEIINSPLDLDGDGTDDIQYSATKENLQTVFQDLGNTMTDEDHLFVFVTGHGHKPLGGSQSPTLYLWNNVQLSPSEFSNYLNLVNAQCINVVMGQCYAGAFINALHGNNRIIATACTEEEKSYRMTDIPFSLFLYNWTSAIAQMDYSETPIYADTDNNGYISMHEAFDYAKEQVEFYDADNRLRNEHPQLDYIAGVLYDDLSLDYIPETVDLYIRDNSNDTGKEMIHDENYFAWNSPDLYVRRFNDGDINHQHQDIYVEDLTSGCANFNVYASIHNRGTKTFHYNQDNKYIHLYATNSNGKITYPKFSGINLLYNEIGHYLGTPRINHDIEPGDSILICLNVNLFADYDRNNNTNHYFPISLLGIISDDNNPMGMNQNIGIDSLVNIRKISNDVAMRNEANANMYPYGQDTIEKMDLSLYTTDDCSIKIFTSNESLKNITSLKLPNGTPAFDIHYSNSTSSQHRAPSNSVISLSNVIEFNRVDFSGQQNPMLEVYFNNNNLFDMNNISEGDSITILQCNPANGDILAGMTYIMRSITARPINDIENSAQISNIRFIDNRQVEIQFSENISDANVSVSSSSNTISSVNLNNDGTSSITINIPEEYNDILYVNLRKNGKLLDSRKIIK